MRVHTLGTGPTQRQVKVRVLCQGAGTCRAITGSQPAAPRLKAGLLCRLCRPVYMPVAPSPTNTTQLGAQVLGL